MSFDPWGKEPAPDDELLAKMDAAAEFARDVDRRAYDFRVNDAARAKVAAEAAADAGFDELYLDRAQLLTLPKPDPLIDGILPRHAYAVLRGRDHSFKTFVAIDWACCLATGKPWQGHAAEQVRVLYIVGEGAYGIAERVAAWEYGWGHDVDPARLTVRRAALDLYAPGPAFDELLQRVEAGGYGLVLVDTLRRVSGRAEGNSSEMGVVVDNLDRIKQATDHGTVCALAHTDKGDHDSRGYSGIEDDADVVWHAKREDERLDLELTKMKDGPDGKVIQLNANTALDSLVLSAGTRPPVNTTESQVKILDTMRELFRDGTHSTALMEATGLTKPTFYRALSALKDAGHVTNTGTRKRPFYELADPTRDPTEKRSHETSADQQPRDQESHEVSPDQPPSDLHESHRSHEVSGQVSLGLTGLTTLRSETTETETDTNPGKPT